MKWLDFRRLKLLYVLSSNCIGLLKCIRLASNSLSPEWKYTLNVQITTLSENILLE